MAGPREGPLEVVKKTGVALIPCNGYALTGWTSAVDISEWKMAHGVLPFSRVGGEGYQL
jgi:hypothetical protein